MSSPARSIASLTLSSDAEMQLAHQLVDHLKVRRFDPNDHVDEFRSRVAAAIQEKIAGHAIALAATPVAELAGNVLDLMAALKASVAANRAPNSAPAMARPKDRKAPKRAPAQHSSTHHPATKRTRRTGV
jgi:DNA end-binding protein Ku